MQWAGAEQHHQPLTIALKFDEQLDEFGNIEEHSLAVARAEEADTADCSVEEECRQR